MYTPLFAGLYINAVLSIFIHLRGRCCSQHPAAFKLPVQHEGRPVSPEGGAGIQDAVPGSGQQELSLALPPVLIFSNWHPSQCLRSPRYSVSVASLGGVSGIGSRELGGLRDLGCGCGRGHGWVRGGRCGWSIPWGHTSWSLQRKTQEFDLSPRN